MKPVSSALTTADPVELGKLLLMCGNISGKITAAQQIGSVAEMRGAGRRCTDLASEAQIRWKQEFDAAGCNRLYPK